MRVSALGWAALAAAALATAAAAAEGRWTSGYGQGLTSATVGNGRATFIVTCVDGSPTAVSGFMLETLNLRADGMDRSVRTQIVVDGRVSAFQFQKRRLAATADGASLSWDAASPGARRDMAAVIARMRRGSSMTVSMPSERIRETFTLLGAGRELRGCPGRR